MSRALVVGAGPTGLTAALMLARNGVAVDLFERNEELGSRSLAATFHPPTLQILSDLGVDLQGDGIAVDRIEYRRGSERIALQLAELADETPFPYRRHVPQLRICERILEELQGIDHVNLHFGMGAEPGQGDDYDLVVAADGSGSQWRTSAGIGFDPQPYPGQVARLICQPDAFDDWAGVTYVFTEDDSVSVLRMADHARIILRVGVEEPDPADLLARAQAVLGMRPAVESWSSYAARRAVCDSNISGNLVIAGDAAHLTNTRGGMNMNAGIHDAAVLCAAFATNPQSLPAAAAQRQRVATEQLLPRTHAAVGSDRFDRVADTAADAAQRHRFLREVSMLDMVQWP